MVPLISGATNKIVLPSPSHPQSVVQLQPWVPISLPAGPTTGSPKPLRSSYKSPHEAGTCRGCGQQVIPECQEWLHAWLGIISEKKFTLQLREHVSSRNVLLDGLRAARAFFSLTTRCLGLLLDIEYSDPSHSFPLSQVKTSGNSVWGLSSPLQQEECADTQISLTGSLLWKHSCSSQEVSFAGVVYQSYPNKINYTRKKKKIPPFVVLHPHQGLFVGVALSLVGMMYLFFHTPSWHN